MLYKITLSCSELLCLEAFIFQHGIHVSSSPCCLYNDVNKSIDHLFFSYVYAKTIWNWLGAWCGVLPVKPCNLVELLEVLKSKNQNRRYTLLRLALIYLALWLIWKARNKLLFRKERIAPLKTQLITSIFLLFFHLYPQTKECH